MRLTISNSSKKNYFRNLDEREIISIWVIREFMERQNSLNLNKTLITLIF